MTVSDPADRTFLFLQGPHGPFFAGLARALREAGSTVWRVGFNAGDRAFWPDRASFLPYRDAPDAWPDWLDHVIQQRQITDLVLYGDTRPVHAQAIQRAKHCGLHIHTFEEGYLRPYWITYERGGSNGHSALMEKDLFEMRQALGSTYTDLAPSPPYWGDLRQHILYGALYHFCVLALNRGYPNFAPHREKSVADEFRLYLNRLVSMPLHRLRRSLATRRIRNAAFPYHIVLLQLEHDANFRAHAPFSSLKDFAAVVIDGFAKGAPPYHHLVFKAHPLEDGRTPLAHDIRTLAAASGIGDRVHFVGGGKLAQLLWQARSAITVNSTAAQQALWRGIPLKAFGAAVYCKPGIVSDQPLVSFFADPTPPDPGAYRDFRRYLLQTSQVPGGYYAAPRRQQVLRKVVDMMLNNLDPYDACAARTAAQPQQFKVVN